MLHALPLGDRTRQILSDLASGRDVQVVVQGTDRHGRTVGRVYAGPVDVNAEMARLGAAWMCQRYSRDASLLVPAQAVPPQPAVQSDRPLGRRACHSDV